MRVFILKLTTVNPEKLHFEYLIFFCSCIFTDGLVVCHLPFGPTAYFTLYNVVMRHDVPDIGTMSEAYPHLIFHNFTSRLGKRVSERWAVHCTHAIDILCRHLFGHTTNSFCSHRYRISSSIFFQCRRRTVGV